MAKDGVGGEKITAQAKVDELERKFDFLGISETPPAHKSIVEDAKFYEYAWFKARADKKTHINKGRPASKKRLVWTFLFFTNRIGPFIQWSIARSLGADTIWFADGDAGLPAGLKRLPYGLPIAQLDEQQFKNLSVIRIHGWFDSKDELTEARSLARYLASSMSKSWIEAATRFGFPLTDQNAFFTGFYDGLYDERIPTGTMVPVTRVRVPKVKKTEEPAPELRMFPYDIGNMMGVECRKKGGIVQARKRISSLQKHLAEQPVH